MTSYIGLPGALVPIVCPAREDSTADRSVSELVPFSGGRVVQLGKGVRRSWSIEYGVEHPNDLAVLDALTRWEAPLVWVGALAQVTNLLTPGMGAMVDASFQGGASARSGALDLDGFPVVAWAGGPVGSTVNVTFAAWTQRSDAGTSANLRYSIRDATGTAIRTQEVAGPAGAGLQRAAWTFTPPAGAADVSLWVRNAAVVAAPQFTWTTGAVEYAPGRGVSQVIVLPGSETPVVAHSKQVLINAAYTILEVG